MGNEITEVSGLADLQKLLDQLPAKIEGNIMRGGLRAGQQIFLERARANCPIVEGDLRDSMRIKTSSRNGKVSATLVAGNKRVYWAVMVEKGTVRHFIRPKGAHSLFFAGLARTVIDHPGAKPHPFMRLAFDGGQAAAIEATAEYVGKRIEKEAAKK
jgi:HK97 gp10 family phage protein